MKMYSYSRISCFKQCHKKFEYQYIKKLFPISDNNNLFLGKLFHHGLEMRNANSIGEYVDGLNRPTSDEEETSIVVAMAMVEGYFKQFGYDENIKRELHFQFNLGDDVIHGYIDGVIEDNDGWWIVEDKTTSMLNKEYVDKLEYNEQIAIYYYALQNGYVENINLKDKPIKGVKYRVMKKPQIRQKVKESVIQYRRRLVEKMEEDGYINEFILDKTNEKVYNVMEDLKEDIRQVKTCQRYTNNLSACTSYGRCPYMDLCSNQENADGLYIEKLVEMEEI